ncbi:MFS transporter [Methanomassiliicoccus luminyensis]|uniref:MFS transporter n=1 Tax=Methanomassiliicoccus luminyensis TaxID=1080712 RepID=UPI000673ED3F|nr:MFS transporter [Methanomassiliicoccus luminyensis]
MSSGFRPTRASLLLILAASMLTLMGGAAVAPALPLISEAFPRASDTDISLIITLPSLAIALTGFAIGHLADKYGKVKVLILSLAIFTVAGSSGYYLGTVQSILAGRFVLGMGIAGMSAASTALVAAYYTGVSRTRVISYQSAAIGLGVLVLETSGGGLATFGWREPFLIYLIGAVILVGVVLTLKEPAREDRAEAQEKEGARARSGRSLRSAT